MTVADLGAPPRRGGWCLGMPFPGALSRLTYRPSSAGAVPLGPHEIRVAVRAAGLNFRDVLTAVGRIPPVSTGLGFEGAGVVVATGRDVTDVTVGDRVLGLLPAAFARYSVTHHRHVVRMPASWSFQRAAAMPIAFLTAWLALVEVARLRAGQAVLVHSAAGGVGTAMVQVARWAGAEPYGSAHPRKWERLAALGLPPSRLCSSRDPDFASRVREQLGDRRLDVVVNCLTGAFVDNSLGLLGPGGVFVEIGKTDPRSADDVARRYPGVHYVPTDIGILGDRTGELLATVVALAERGELAAPPCTTVPLRTARTAFHLLATAGHFGKIVLVMPHDEDPA